MLKKSLILISLFALLLSFSSCVQKEVKVPPEAEGNLPEVKEEAVTAEKRIDPYLFTPDKKVSTEEKNIVFTEYEGGKERTQKYTLDFYKETENFTSAYEGIEFEKKVFDGLLEYDSFSFQKAFGAFLYFLTEKDGEKSFMRYSMEDGSFEKVFSYNGENDLSIASVSDKYLIFREDENANWCKVSISCLDLTTGEAKRFFTYSRDENDMMYSWNFDDIVIDGNRIYFDNTESYLDGKAHINLYEYNAVTGDITVIDEERATKPLTYNGISYIGYDEGKKEYILKNTVTDKEKVYLGNIPFTLIGAKDLAVCKKDKALFYYDGNNTYPIIESSTHIDTVSCSDGYIVWDGWNNDAPLFYDIRREKIISVDPLNDGKRYVGYVSDDYLIFEAHEYVPNTALGEDSVTTDALIYYFVKTDMLNKNLKGE
ncbi:MAG: hypothetical protein IJ323_00010 [Clostridia bacterium]|nr:hypothetical protein [Clostridia bacterium]